MCFANLMSLQSYRQCFDSNLPQLLSRVGPSETDSINAHPVLSQVYIVTMLIALSTVYVTSSFQNTILDLKQ